MGNPLVTVVLPIYGVEKYLDRCVSSVVNQTYDHLEILLVDDGSPDNCPQMCDQWAHRDCRIRVIHKENQGLGMARNTGIENATGEYICFFDSDDYIRQDSIELLVDKIQREQTELAVFGFFSVSNQGKIVSTFIPGVGDRTYRGESVLTEFLPDFTAPNPYKNEPRGMYMSACLVMYSMELVRRSQWRFVSERDIISEDVYSLMSLIRHVRSVTVLPEALYYICENGSSLSRSYRPERYQRIRHFYLKVMQLSRECGYNEDVLHRVSKPYIAFTIAALKQEATSSLPLSQRMAHIRQIVDDDLLQQVLLQNKNDVVSRTRWLMLLFMRWRAYWLVYLLLSVRS